MTRLQKDAVKELAVLLLAVIAVGTAYALTHNLIHSLCWLGLLGFLGILAMFPTVGPEPEMKPEDDFSLRRGQKTLSILIFTAVWAVLQGVYLTAYPKNGIAWTPTLAFAVFALLIAWRNRKVIRLRYRMPKYDEREMLVQKNAARVSLGIFWVAFALWGVVAGILSDSRTWHLPGATYAFQVAIGLWLVKTVYAIAVILQERRAGE